MLHRNASAVKDNVKQCFMQRPLVDTTKKTFPVRWSESSPLVSQVYERLQENHQEQLVCLS